MLTGKGEQLWMTNYYEDRRKHALRFKYFFSDDYLDKYDITDDEGTGKTYDHTYLVWQFPFPINQNIRQRKRIDIRKVPVLGID